MTSKDSYLNGIESIPESTLSNLGKELGVGNHSVVYSVNDHDDLAIKEYTLDNLTSEETGSLLKVLRMSVSLDHSNILNCRRITNDNDTVYVEIDRYQKSLDSLIRAYRRTNEAVPITLIRRIARCVCGGLNHIHSLNNAKSESDGVSSFAHGGIKPSNILFDDTERRIVISDAGLWRYKKGTRSKSLNANLTIYLAPEVINGDEPSPISDMWSLGVILYELCIIGNLNNSKNKPACIDLDSIDLTIIDDGVLRGLIGRLLIKDKDRRISSNEMLSLLVSSEADVATSTALEVMFLRDELKQMIESLSVTPKTMYFKNKFTCFSFSKSFTKDYDHLYAEPDFLIPAEKVYHEKLQNELEETEAQIKTLNEKYEAAMAAIERLGGQYINPATNVDTDTITGGYQDKLSNVQSKDSSLLRELNALRAQDAENKRRNLELQEQLSIKDNRINELEIQIQAIKKDNSAKQSPIPQNYLNATAANPYGNIPSYAITAATAATTTAAASMVYQPSLSSGNKN